MIMFLVNEKKDEKINSSSSAFSSGHLHYEQKWKIELKFVARANSTASVTTTADSKKWSKVVYTGIDLSLTDLYVTDTDKD